MRGAQVLTIDWLWQGVNFNPTDRKREAIQHTEGPLYLPAGLASGKTRVLLWRTLNLIAFHEVSPDAIYLLTFTEKADRQLKDGLLGLASNVTGRPYDISQMYVGTVHSFCRCCDTRLSYSSYSTYAHAASQGTEARFRQHFDAYGDDSEQSSV